jgi:extradiol dioxygenase family protein
VYLSVLTDFHKEIPQGEWLERIKMSNRFHLAIAAGDLNVALRFYCDLLGCNKGHSETASQNGWVDIDFWGNELTLHGSNPGESVHGNRHDVDSGDVVVPHFGVHLSGADFAKLKQRLYDRRVTFVNPPYIRFADTVFEQETFFIEDPHGNVLEIKTMKHPDKLFEMIK